MRIGEKLIGEIGQMSDYVTVYCAQCKDKQLGVDLVGMHGHVALLKFSCKECGLSREWKLNNTGLGFLDMTKGNRGWGKSE